MKYTGVGAWRQGGRVHMQTREVAKPALGQVQRDLDDTPHGRWYVSAHCVLRVHVGGGRFHFTHQERGVGRAHSPARSGFRPGGFWLSKLHFPSGFKPRMLVLARDRTLCVLW